MKKLIDGVPFCTNRHYNCVHVVLDSLLRYYHCEPSVPAFYNWDFFYFRGESFSIQSRAKSLFEMLREFSIEPFIYTSNDGRNAWHKIKRLLDIDTPVAISLDVFPLARAGLYPRQRHADHQNIVVGYDDEAGTVHLVDPSPWQPSARDIPLELFFSCWDTSALSGREQHPFGWCWLDVPARRPALSPRHVYTILQRNFRSMSATSKKTNCVPGIAGIEQLAKDSVTWAGYAKPALKAHLGQCTELLLDVALHREGHGMFLRHASQVCNLPSLAILGREFETISQSWFVVKNLCFKGAVKETTRVLPRIQSRLCALAERERIALAILAEVTGG